MTQLKSIDSDNNTPNFLQKNKTRGERLKRTNQIKNKVLKEKVKGRIVERKSEKNNERYVGIISKTKTTVNNQTKPQSETKQEKISEEKLKSDFEEVSSDC